MKNYKTLTIKNKKYTLLKIFKDFSSENSFGVGLFVSNNKKYVIRILNDITNKDLVNQLKTEFYLLKELENNKHKLNIPRAIELGINNDQYYLIREYAVGIEIKNEKIAQEKVEELITYFNSLTYKDINFKNKENLIRSNLKMSLGVSIYAIKNIIKDPKKIMKYVKLLAVYYRNLNFKNLFSDNLFFSHRDISPENILLDNKSLSIIDFEISAFAAKETDLCLSAYYFSKKWSYQTTIELITHFLKNKSEINNFKRLACFYILQFSGKYFDNKIILKETLNYTDIFLNRIIPDLNKIKIK